MVQYSVTADEKRENTGQIININDRDAGNTFSYNVKNTRVS